MSTPAAHGYRKATSQ